MSDLDDILDSALEEYEQVIGNEKSAASTLALSSTEATRSSTSVSPNLKPEYVTATGPDSNHDTGCSVAADTSATPELNQEETKTLQEALKALNEMSEGLNSDLLSNLEGINDPSLFGDSADSAGGEGADDKFLEQLLSSLAKQVEGMSMDTKDSDVAHESSSASSSTADNLDETAKVLQQYLQQIRENKGATDLPETPNLASQNQSMSSSSSQGPASPNPSPNPDQFEKLVEGIVEQLLSRDILKQPMLQMQQKYRDYLGSTASIPMEPGSAAASDRQRYVEQAKIVDRIVQVYETDSNLQRVMELLEEMQKFGSPPESISEELSAANNAAATAASAGAGSSSSGIPLGNTNAPTMEELDALQKFSNECATQ